MDLSQTLQSGVGHPWLLLPTAAVLGALHGLEPGHSKTMMAAFIIAVRGTIGQAALLGLAAAASHSVIIWALAGAALHFGQQWNAETTEPYFQLGSAIVIAALALWMFWRTRRDVRAAADHHREHEHSHEHGHDHEHGHGHTHEHSLPSSAPAAEYQDAHEAAHAQDIAGRFANRQVTTGQIILFGLSGGLLPCPAAFTVLIVCLQLKRFTLGFAMVGAFSCGLAATLVLVGVAAAWSVRHAQKRFAGFGDFLRRAPYFSSAVLLVLAAYMAWAGWRGLAGAA